MMTKSADKRHFLPALLPVCVSVLALSWALSVQCQHDEEANKSGQEGAVIATPSGRAVYSPRLAYSPHHQIMHFGKRPELVGSLASGPRVYDLYSSPLALQIQQQQDQQQASRLGNKFPTNWFNLKLQQDQLAAPVEPLEEDATAFEFPPSVNSKAIPIYSMVGLEPSNRMTSNLMSNNQLLNKLLLQQAVAAAAQSTPTSSAAKFSRLLSDSSAESALPGTGSGDSGNSSPGEQQAINLVARSPHSASRTGNNNFISTLLLGRGGGSPSNFGPFIKKAEPKDNIFMHFG